jgi:hypothetical protein
MSKAIAFKVIERMRSGGVEQLEVHRDLVDGERPVWLHTPKPSEAYRVGSPRAFIAIGDEAGLLAVKGCVPEWATLSKVGHA